MLGIEEEARRTSAMAAQSLHTAHSLILLAPGTLSLAPAVDVVAGGSLGQIFGNVFGKVVYETR